MARLPGIADLGPAVRADPERQVAGYDTSGLDRAAQSVASIGQATTQATAQFGAGLNKLGQGIEEFQQDKNRWEYGVAHSDFLTKKIDLDAATKTDTNYGPDADGKTLPQRYGEAVNKQRDASAAMISDPAMRQFFLTRTQPTMEEGIVGAQAHARGLQNNADVAYVTQQGTNIMNKAVAAPDDGTRTQLIDAHNELVDGLAARGAVTPLQAVTMKQDWAHQYATADLLAKADTDPEGVINELRAKPGSGASITNRIVGIEGSGRNKASSADGTGQFIDATWLDVLKRNRPDLAQGRSDQDLLALRADKTLGRQMTEAYRGENERYLRGQGVDATPGAQYLAHFLGPGGAVAVLKGDPSKPVADVLAKAVGPDKAAKMVAANPTILGGQLTGSVKQWAENKMGGQSPGGGTIYDMIRPDVRETILAHAQAQLQKNTVNDLSGFKAQIEDSQTEAMRTGNVTNPIPKEAFVAKLGAQFGPQAYEGYQANVQLGRDTARVAAMDPGEQNALLASYEPKAGDGYADAAKRQDILMKALKGIEQEKQKDPATFAITRLPASSEAYEKFTQAANDPTADPAAKTAAARDFASKTLMEQNRVGIPPDQQRIVPKAYVDEFNKSITAAGDSDDPQKRVGLIAQVQQQAALWGDAWPQVMRQLAPTAQPIVRAIAAGADTTAITRLLSLGKDENNPAKILKEQNDTKFRDVTTALNDAMTPFRRSLVGRQMDRDYPGYYGLAEKLASVYVRDGQSASDAAGKAFNDLVGNRYEFRDTFRIPKSAGVSADDVQAGAQAARFDLDKLGVKAAANDIGLADPRGDSMRKFGRDGTWVTSPDNNGLNLAYGDKFVRGQDDKPLFLSWRDLATRGGTPASRAETQRRTAAESLVVQP